jgi:hypothetical protein
MKSDKSSEPKDTGSNLGNTSSLEEQFWTPQVEEFKAHRDRVWEDRQASADAFDKALLTFSSGALALSLAFTKNIVPFARAVHPSLLLASWICFLICIVITILSFRFSIAAMDRQLVFLEEYYLNGKRDFLNPKNSWSNVVNACAIVGALFFLAGLLSTVIFVYSNAAKLGGI